MAQQYQTLKEAIKVLEDKKFECVNYPNDWISEDMEVNAKIIGDAVTCRYKIEYLF